MKNCSQSVLETFEGLCDSIHTEWRVYQTKIILEDRHRNCSKESALLALLTQHSYWKYSLSVCMMKPVLTTFETNCSMDKFWQKVGTMTDSDSSLKGTVK